MGLYNISAMEAILDMQISWFSNLLGEIHQRVFIDLVIDTAHQLVAYIDSRSRSGCHHLLVINADLCYKHD